MAGSVGTPGAEPTNIYQGLTEVQQDLASINPPEPPTPVRSSWMGVIGDLPAGLAAGLLSSIEMLARDIRLGNVKDEDQGLKDVVATWFIEKKPEIENALPSVFKQPTLTGDPWSAGNVFRTSVFEGSRSFVQSIMPILIASEPGQALGAALGMAIGKTPQAAELGRRVGGIATGALGGGIAFGLQEYDQFAEDVYKFNQKNPQFAITDNEWKPWAAASAIQEAGLEFTGDLVIGSFLDRLGVGRAATKTVKQLLERGTTAGVKDYAATVGKLSAVEIPTEMAQSYLEGRFREEAGLPQETSPEEQALQAIGPTFFASLLFAGVGHGRGAKMRGQVTKVLEDAEADVSDRHRAAEIVFNELKKLDGTNDTDLASKWQEYAAYKIVNQEPMELNKNLESLRTFQEMTKERFLEQQLSEDVKKFEERGIETPKEVTQQEELHPENEKTGRRIIGYELFNFFKDDFIKRGFDENRATQLAQTIMGARGPIVPSPMMVQSSHIVDEQGNPVMRPISEAHTPDSFTHEKNIGTLMSLPELIRKVSLTSQNKAGEEIPFVSEAVTKKAIKEANKEKELVPFRLNTKAWIAVPKVFSDLIQRGLETQRLKKITPTATGEVPAEIRTAKGNAFTSKGSVLLTLRKLEQKMPGIFNMYEPTKIGHTEEGKEQWIAKRKEITSDRTNIARLSSKVQQGEKPVKTGPVTGTGEGKITASGNVQEQRETPLSKEEKRATKKGELKRKAKQAQEKTSTIIIASDIVSSKRILDRIAKEDLKDVTVKVELENGTKVEAKGDAILEEAIKKKVGRPKKERPAVEPGPKRKPGRPPKPVTGAVVTGVIEQGKVDTGTSTTETGKTLPEVMTEIKNLKTQLVNASDFSERSTTFDKAYADISEEDGKYIVEHKQESIEPNQELIRQETYNTLPEAISSVLKNKTYSQHTFEFVGEKNKPDFSNISQIEKDIKGGVTLSYVYVGEPSIKTLPEVKKTLKKKARYRNVLARLQQGEAVPTEEVAEHKTLVKQWKQTTEGTWKEKGTMTEEEREEAADQRAMAKITEEKVEEPEEEIAPLEVPLMTEQEEKERRADLYDMFSTDFSELSEKEIQEMVDDRIEEEKREEMALRAEIAKEKPVAKKHKLIALNPLFQTAQENKDLSTRVLTLNKKTNTLVPKTTGDLPSLLNALSTMINNRWHLGDESKVNLVHLSDYLGQLSASFDDGLLNTHFATSEEKSQFDRQIDGLIDYFNKVATTLVGVKAAKVGKHGTGIDFDENNIEILQKDKLTAIPKKFAKVKQPRTHEKAGNLKAKDIATHIDKFVEEHPGLPIVTIYDSIYHPDVPVDILLNADLETQFIPGVYWPNNDGYIAIHLFADQIADLDEALGTLLHEALVHHGMWEMLGVEEFKPILRQIYSSYKDTPLMKTVVKEYEIDESIEGDSSGTSGNRGQLLAAEEFLAFQAQDPKNQLSETLWEKIIAFVRNKFRDWGIVKTYTDGDIKALLARSQRFLAEKPSHEFEALDNLVGRKAIVTYPKVIVTMEEIKEAFNKATPISIEKSVGTKIALKDNLKNKLYVGTIKPNTATRITTIDELRSIVENNELFVGEDFEGYPGISAQLISNISPIVAYGANDKISVAIIFPTKAIESEGVQDNEVKIDPATKVTDLKFIIDGQEEILSFKDLQNLYTEKTNVIDFISKEDKVLYDNFKDRVANIIPGKRSAEENHLLRTNSVIDLLEKKIVVEKSKDIPDIETINLYKNEIKSMLEELEPTKKEIRTYLTPTEQKFFDDVFSNEADKAELLELVPSFKLENVPVLGKDKATISSEDQVNLANYIDDVVRLNEGEKVPPSFYTGNFSKRFTAARYDKPGKFSRVSKEGLRELESTSKKMKGYIVKDYGKVMIPNPRAGEYNEKKGFIQPNRLRVDKIIGLRKVDKVFKNEATNTFVIEFTDGSSRSFSNTEFQEMYRKQNVQVEKAKQPIKYAKVSKQGTLDPNLNELDPAVLKNFWGEEAKALLKTISAQRPRNLPALTFMERLLRSPEWYSHPVLRKLVDLAIKRHDRYYELFHTLDEIENSDETVSQRTTALRNKGLTRWQIVRGETSDDYKLFSRIVDEGDTGEWREKVDNPDMSYLQYLENQNIPQDVLELYKAHRVAYDKALDLLMEPLVKTVTEVEDEAKAKNKKPQYPQFQTYDEEGKITTVNLKEVLHTMGQLKGSYAPRLREVGEWEVVGKRGEEEEVRYHKSNRLAAERLAASLTRQGFTIEPIKERERLHEDVYGNLRLVSIHQAINLAMKGTKLEAPELRMKFENELLDNIADIIKARGFRGSMIRRRKDKIVRGYIVDPGERFVRYVGNISAGLAKAEAAKNMFSTITGKYVTDEEGSKKKVGGIDEQKERRAYEVATKYVEEQLRNADNTDRLIGYAKSVASFKYLGFNPRTLFVNVLALGTTVPTAIHQYVMGGKGSLASIGAEITRSSKDYIGVMRGQELPNANEQKLVDEIHEKGYDMPQYMQDAMGTLQRTHGRIWNQSLGLALFGFKKSEQWIRGSTILAAYRLAKKNNPDLTHDEAVAKAYDASNKAHAVYGKATLPSYALGKNPAAKLFQMLYTFQKFPHNYLQMLYDVGFKKKNVKGFLYGLMSPIFLAGMAVAPLKDIWVGIFNALLRLLGIKVDAEKWFWDKTRKSMGKSSETILRHGLIGALGLDVSGSLNINAGLPRNMYELLGVGGGLVKDVGDALHYTKLGEYGRAAEKTLPTGIGNLFKAYRELSGVTTTKGTPVFNNQGMPYKASAFETGARVLGFRSAQQATMVERRSEALMERENFTQMRDDIYEQYRNSLMSNDSKMLQKTMDKVVQYNNLVVRYNLGGQVPVITKESLKRQAKALYVPNKAERVRLLE
jgi:hypothetical protein